MHIESQKSIGYQDAVIYHRSHFENHEDDLLHDFAFDNLKTYSISCLAAFAASNYYRRELWESKLA
jgi:hypothetical protein